MWCKGGSLKLKKKKPWNVCVSGRTLAPAHSHTQMSCHGQDGIYYSFVSSEASGGSRERGGRGLNSWSDRREIERQELNTNKDLYKWRTRLIFGCWRWLSFWSLQYRQSVVYCHFTFQHNRRVSVWSRGRNRGCGWRLCSMVQIGTVLCNRYNVFLIAFSNLMCTVTITE